MSNPATILITGATGQVGTAIVDALARESSRWQLHAPSRSELDLSDEASIRAYIRRVQPRCVINPAAYTAVDKAESDIDLAYRINAEAPRILGEEARVIGASIVHFSTDYVFDGTKPEPYIESDSAQPLGVYGASKLAGEQALAASGAPHIILRTSWVFGATGKNFLLTILRLARELEQMKIVDDQHGAPTSACSLAALTAHILTVHPDLQQHAGLYHATSSGETTWYGFAAEAIRQARQLEPSTRFAELLPIPTSDYPTPARRPANSRLDCSRLARHLNYRLPDWRESLAETMSELADRSS